MGRAVPFHAAVPVAWRRMVLEKEAGTRMKSFLFALTLLLPINALADSSALILRGVAGDEEHAQKFTKWTDDTRKALVDKFGFSADRVIVLADKNTAQAEIKKAFATLKSQLK